MRKQLLLLSIRKLKAIGYRLFAVDHLVELSALRELSALVEKPYQRVTVADMYR